MFTKENRNWEPPELIGRNKFLSVDELLPWFRQLHVPDWDDWSDEECLQRLTKKLSSKDEWYRRIVCDCGCTNAFRILSTDWAKPVAFVGEIEITAVHIDLLCGACDTEISVFDSNLNGWNAVVCDEKSLLPSDYIETVRAVRRVDQCRCGSDTSSCIVWYCFYAEDPDELPVAQLGNSFGAFAAWAECSACGKARDIAEAETA